MGKSQVPGDLFSQLAIPTGGTPAGAQAGSLDIGTGQFGGAKPNTYMITCIVTVAPSDVNLWVEQAHGDPTTEADNIWSLFNDKYGTVKLGKLGTALAIGNHTFVVEDLGVYRRLYFTKSAGTVDVHVRPIQ